MCSNTRTETSFPIETQVSQFEICVFSSTLTFNLAYCWCLIKTQKLRRMEIFALPPKPTCRSCRYLFSLQTNISKFGLFGLSSEQKCQSRQSVFLLNTKESNLDIFGPQQNQNLKVGNTSPPKQKQLPNLYI